MTSFIVIARPSGRGDLTLVLY